MDIEKQKELTKNIGWKDVKKYAEEKKDEIKKKVTNIAGGVEVVIKKLKGKD